MEQTQRHLVELLRRFDTGVLVTKTPNGTLHGRPMRIAKVEDDATVYLSTSLYSPKVAEIEADPVVGLFFQDATHWLSLSGDAQLHRDRMAVDELWDESWRLWFPDGKDSRELCLLRIEPRSGEYWDVSGKRGIQFAFDAVKAYLSGRKPDRGLEGNAKVAL